MCPRPLGFRSRFRHSPASALLIRSVRSHTGVDTVDELTHGDVPVSRPHSDEGVVAPARPLVPVLALAIALTALLLVALLVVLRRDHQQRIEQGERRVAAIALGADRQLTLELRNLERALQGVASDAEQLSHGVPEAAAGLLAKAAQGVDQRHAELLGVVVVDRGGRPLTPGIGDPRIGVWATNPDNQTRPGGLIMGLPYRLPDSGEWVLPLAVPLPIAPGGGDGWVVSRLRLTALDAVGQGLDLGADGVLEVHHRDGTLVARSHDAWHAIGSHDTAVPRRDWPAGGSAAVRQSARAVDGVVRVHAFRSLSDFPLVLSVGVARHTLLAPWRSFAALAGLLYLVLIAGSGWLLLALLRQQRRQAALLAALARNAGQLRDAQAIAGLGTWELDADDRRITLSDTARDMLGLPGPASTFDLDDCLARIWSDDLAAVRTAYRQIFSEGQLSQQCEFHVPHAGGRRTIQARGTVVARRDGGAVRQAAGTMQDVTDWVQVHVRAEAAESSYRLLFEHNPLPFWVFDRQTMRVLDVNTAAIRDYGYSRDEFLRMTIMELRPPEDVEAAMRYANGPEHQDRSKRIWRHRHKDGAIRQVMVHTADFEFDGVPARLVLVIDVTERLQAEAERDHSQQRFSMIARATSDAIWDWDPASGTIWWSDSFYNSFGFSREEGADGYRFWLGQVHPEDAERVDAGLAAAIAGDATRWEASYRFHVHDGTLVHIVDRCIIVRDAQGRAVRAVGAMVDVTERIHYEELLNYQATHDGLTGLPNREALLRHLSTAILAAETAQRAVTVLYIDLNQFRLINDSFGHAVGDEVLRVVASRLRRCLDGAYVARFGSDEFVVVVDGAAQGPSIHTAAQHVLDAFANPLDAHGTVQYLSPSMGYARYPDDGQGPERLLMQAGLATHEAKQRGLPLVGYAPEFEDAVNTRMDVIARLHEALERGEFELHYQPQFEVHGLRPTGIEALVRWHHPERGLLPPAEFIPICENSGLIVPLGRWVLREACRQHRRLAAAGWGGLRIAVNVSTAQFLRGELLADVAAAMTEFALPPGVLELELTESVLMDSPDTAIATMHALAELGVTVSIDDFGTGYSSLAYLKRLPVGKLKIDGSFVHDLGNDADSAAICVSIIALARSLDLRVIAEGVETQAQLDWLRRNGCDEMQGYLHARPMPIDALLQMLVLVAVH